MSGKTQALGSVRKVMSQTPHGASQRNHCPKTFRQLVVTGAYPPALLQPAKHALDDVALSVLGLVEQSGQAKLGFTLHATVCRPGMSQPARGVMELRELDLNLLLVFNQLLIDRRVSTAADNLEQTQPAVSNALKRLRTALNDELFVRTY